MNTLRVIVVFKLKGKEMDNTVTFLKEFAKRSKETPGCFNFEFLQGTEDPSEFSFVETWSGEEAFLGHTQSDNFRAFAPYIATHFAELSVHKMKNILFF